MMSEPKLNLTEEQLKFLNEEFGLTEVQLLVISKDEWRDIREKSFFIEDEELVGDSCTDRGETAADIASIKYSKLFK